ncbi:tyrosine-type recombinase/integrase [Sneathiella sp. P13V-1]|uniref:tyrosine-type recombinase/integrase n=1 Tax=Sneathiella sp. P13V-1 TaxID=2697366 RepID=UPI00187B699D|nr:site-specific integrase [Sneathiella sp. P13V-1]MBE7635249.1 tyrosine-type recombinase/integrase [Sneathiella sp. P13V-1]
MTVYLPKGAKTYVMDFELLGQRVKRSTGETSKRKAQRVEEEFKAEMRERHKKFGSVQIPTYWDAVEYYLKLRQTSSQRSKGAVARDQANHERFISHIGADTPIDAINAPMLAQYVNKRLGGEGEKKGVAISTVKREMNDLKAVLNRAKEICPSYTLPQFPKLQDSDTRVRYLSDDEEKSLMSVLPDWLKDVVTFALHTGARKQDILDFKWRDVIWSNEKPTAVRIPKPKSRKPYRIPASKTIVELIVRLAAHKEGDDSHVFRALHGGPIGDMKRAWEKAVSDAGIENFVFHDLRHTFASRLVMRDVGLKQVQELMGHSSIQMTLKYAHLAPSALDDAVNVLDQ